MDALGERFIDRTVAKEGNYVNDPRDSGGETIFGITFAVAREEGFKGPMRSMSRDQAKAIYYSRFYVKPRFVDVSVSSPRIAEELFDTGVNMGVAKASEFLQIALNALNNGGQHYPDIKEDGAIGPGTLAALRAYLARRGPRGETVMLRALNCLQGAGYIDLARRRPKDEAFVFGWLDNRVEVPA